MTKFKDITLGMDLSLNGPGFAVIAVEPDTGEYIILEARSINNKNVKTTGEKLAIIAKEIDDLLKQYEPKHVVREKGFSRFPTVTQALFRVVGISDYVCYVNGYDNIPEITPPSVKKAVTGSGKATKKQVADAVMKILKIEDENYFKTDDETDATAVALTMLNRVRKKVRK